MAEYVNNNIKIIGMSEAWKWEKVSKTEYKLTDSCGLTVGYLALNYDRSWCLFYNDDFDMKFRLTIEGLKNTEEVIWQATLCIYKTCSQVANSFHRIRDHLPSLDELRIDSENKN